MYEYISLLFNVKLIVKHVFKYVIHTCCREYIVFEIKLKLKKNKVIITYNIFIYIVYIDNMNDFFMT